MKRITVCREGHVSPEDVIFCPKCGDADDIRFEFIHEDWCQVHEAKLVKGLAMSRPTSRACCHSHLERLK